MILFAQSNSVATSMEHHLELLFRPDSRHRGERGSSGILCLKIFCSYWNIRWRQVRLVRQGQNWRREKFSSPPRVSQKPQTKVFFDMHQRPRSSSVSSQASEPSDERDGSDRIITSTPNHVRSVTSIRHNSVVSAMLTSNSLRDCNQVNDMVTKCLVGKEESFMCNTAHRYLAKCTSRDM